MNYTYELWKMEQQEHSIGSIDLFYEPESHHSLLHYKSNLEFPKIEAQEHGGCIKMDQSSGPTEPEAKESAALQKIQPSANKQRGPENRYPEQKTKLQKKSKPSPYHNYQKHLNTSLKHLIIFPETDPSAPQLHQIAQQLWSVFMANESPTKKILHFIFNQFNEYRLKLKELRQFGFEGIYSRYSQQMLAEAKNYLTNVAASQLDEENIDNYLATRRIKSPSKFKRYLLLFKKELLDGFLKKRFTNRNRKEQIRKEIGKNT